jgi:hypothetical protein
VQDCNASEKPRGAPTSHLICKAKPPTPMLYGMQEAPAGLQLNQRQMMPIINAHYPAVGPDDWCREWLPRTEGEA